MPKTSRTKVQVHTNSSIFIEADNSSVNLTLEQRKKQAEEPIYLNRM
jgi:hypothetical protein